MLCYSINSLLIAAGQRGLFFDTGSFSRNSLEKASVRYFEKKMPYFIGTREIHYIGEEVCSKFAYKSIIGVPQRFSDIIQIYNSSHAFTDPEFPPCQANVGECEFAEPYAEMFPNWDRTIQWKRVSEIAPNFKTIFNSCTAQERHTSSPYSRFDINQGNLGDCWFLSSLAELTLHLRLFEFVVPSDNLANNDSHAYHFRMCFNGLWIDTVVDDYVPCCEFKGPGNGYRTVGLEPLRNKEVEEAEIWMVMAEKAYAKLHGCYSNIEGGDPKVALSHLTGGLGYSTKLDPANPTLTFKDLQMFDFHRGNFAVFFTNTSKDYGKVLDNGLIGGHAYSMTGLGVFEIEGIGSVQTVRIRNPWGRNEWNGDWSDSSPLWDRVCEEEKNVYHVRELEDGEFWMSFDDASKYFVQLDYCFHMDDVLNDMDKGDTRAVKFLIHHGQWSEAIMKAGGRDNPAQNPQYIVMIGQPGDSEEETYDVIVGLMYKSSLKKKKSTTSPQYGYHVYWVYDPSCTIWKWSDSGFGEDFFAATDYNYKVKTSSTMTGEEKFDFFCDEINNKFTLRQGTYLFVAATLDPGIEADYCLRIWWQM